jgi:hypothetical protein
MVTNKNALRETATIAQKKALIWFLIVQNYCKK